MNQTERVYRTDLKLLRYFLAVAEELHFGKAAARLNMSQPPLSIHIKELESQLGTVLFLRHSRSVALTHAGKVLMEETRNLLSTANQALARVEQIGRGERGRIELGIVGTALWGSLRPALYRFIKDNPTVDIIFREKSPGVQMTLLERHEIDAGIWRMADTPPLGLNSLRLQQASFLVALPTEHRLTRYSSIPLHELRNEPFVALPAVHSDWSFLQKVCFRAGFSPHIVREAIEPQTVLALISMGLGITFMADSYAQMNWPGVVFRPLDERIPADLYVVYDELQVTSTTLRLIEEMKQISEVV
ncbi:LysR family transcriptional regulator [Pragia fontium]|uniref:LysR family transcriptional regulator n=1 Tax=Pragia fontium TaxID=82985 RepID=UPI000F715421|nr:LysR family transcriptional regulator [Pragia fontium]VEJ54862.1 Hca operon transcriptional activator [Pragia fontium]